VNNSIAIRPDNALVADLKVRQALLHGTNTKEIVETLFSPRYPQARSVIAHGSRLCGPVGQAGL
jgi:peptide/nickel transport system substrate-binding protein